MACCSYPAREILIEKTNDFFDMLVALLSGALRLRLPPLV
nr:MAG TPA: hypothetical protein [Caudoviricetes sp.]